MAGWADRVDGEVSKVFVGQTKLVRGVLTALLADGHVLIESVPGLGKTLLVRVLGRVLGCAFSRIQFTPDLMPSDVTGSPIYDERIADFRFRPGPVFTQILLADEINRAPAKTHSALLEIMQESRVTIDGVSHADRAAVPGDGHSEPDRIGRNVQPSRGPARPISLEARGGVSERRGGDRHPQAAHPRPGAGSRRRSGARGGDEPGGGARDAAPRSRGAGRRARAGLHFEPGAQDAASGRRFRWARRRERAWRSCEPRGPSRRSKGASYILPDDVQDVLLPALRHRVILTPEAEVEGRSAGRAAHRADPIRRGSPAMKMIWPGRALGVAFLVPALLSLTLLISEDFLPLVLVVDTAVGGARGLRSVHARGGEPDLVRAANRKRSARSMSPGTVELVLENQGAAPRFLTVRDDVPDEFTAEPASFEVKLPAQATSYARISIRAQEGGGPTVSSESTRCVSSRLGFWRRQSRGRCLTEVRVYPDIHQLARYTMLARRDRLSTIGVRRSRRLGHGQRVRAAARLHRGG